MQAQESTFPKGSSIMLKVTFNLEKELSCLKFFKWKKIIVYIKIIHNNNSNPNI